MTSKTRAERTARIADLGEQLSALRVLEPSAVREMERSVARHGQLTPLVVYRSCEQLEVIDGFKRLRAARVLRVDELAVKEIEADAAQAKAAIYVLNQRHGITELEESWLVRSLYRDEHLTQPAIAHLLQRHKSWVCRRLALAEELEPGVAADVRLGLVPIRTAIALTRLPRGNQPAVAAAVGGLTTRQAEHLVAALLAVPAGPARDAALAAAQLEPTLPSRRELRAQARSQAEWVVLDIAQLTRVAGRLQARLLERPLDAHNGKDLGRILGDLRPVLAALLSTLDRLTRKDPHVELDHS